MPPKKDIIKPPKTEAEAAIWLIVGADDFLVSRHAREVVNRMCPPADQAMGLEIVNGRAPSVDAAVLALQQCRLGLETVGLFGSSKVVWLRDATFLYDNLVGRSALVKAELARLVAELKRGLMPGQRLVVNAEKVDKRSAFYKTCQTLGELREFAVPEKSYEQEKYARDIIRMLLGEAGLEASETAIVSIIGKVGCDSRLLAKEIEKLRDYLGARTRIEDADVRQIVSPARESAGWDLADALGDRNLGKALELLRQLLFQGEKEFLLIMGLQNRVRELIVYRTCLDQGWLELKGSEPWIKAEWRGAGDAEPLFAELPDNLHPGRVHPFRAGRLAAQARRYSRAELIRAQRILLEVHESMIRTSAPPDLLLEVGLVKITGNRHAA